MGEIARRDFVTSAVMAAPLAVTSLRAAAATPEKYDFVIAGAGHNSLFTACYLQMAGFKCVVVEGRPTVGGGVKTSQLTLAGFHHDVCSSIHGAIQENPALRNNELRLVDYGLEYIFPLGTTRATRRSMKESSGPSSRAGRKTFGGSTTE